MQIDRDEFIFGLPIDTEYGKIRFLKYIEFTKYKVETYLFNQNVLHIYYMYRKDAEGDKEKIELIEPLKEAKLFELVYGLPQFKQAYVTLLGLVLDMNGFDSETLNQIVEEILNNEEKFNYYRKLIQDMNLLKEVDVSADETTQKYIEMARQAKDENGQPNSILNIIASLAVATSHRFEELANMTVMQVTAMYYKLNQFKNYETSTLFATVSNDVKVESWSEIPDLFKPESLTIDGKDFSKKYGGLTK